MPWLSVYVECVDCMFFKLIFAYERSQQTKNHLLANYELFDKYGYIYTDYHGWMEQISKGESMLLRREYLCEKKILQQKFFDKLSWRCGWVIFCHLQGLAKRTPGGLVHLRKKWLIHALSGLAKEMLAS